MGTECVEYLVPYFSKAVPKGKVHSRDGLNGQAFPTIGHR